MSERFSPQQQQILALAAVFQAAQLADDIALRGDCDPRMYYTLGQRQGLGIGGRANAGCG